MAKKRNRKITLNEFRAWLEGVEELQPEDWSPSNEQWKLIREKINCIKESEPKVVPVPARQIVNNQVQPQQSFIEDINHPLPPPPPPVGGIPTTARPSVAMTPEARQLLQGNAGASISKTPDIDNTDGKYESSFL